MPYRPNTSSGGSFYGFKECKIVSVSLPEEHPAWNPDICIDFEMEIEGSKYTKTYRLSGKFDRDPDGFIMSGSLLNRIYNLVDTLGMSIGVDKDGDWVDSEDVKIDNVVELFTKAVEHLNSSSQEKYPVYGYLFKAAPNEGYTKPLIKFANRIMLNNEKGREELENFISFMKSNKYLKEYVESDTFAEPVATETKPPF